MQLEGGYTVGVQRASFRDMHCSVAQALEVVGEWWTLLILRDAFFGFSRFEDFCQRLGISRNILAARLDKLVEAGVLERRPYQDHPPRYDYRLTEKGRELWPVLVSLRQWGDRWQPPAGGPPFEVVHVGCGEVADARLHCARCGEPLTLGSLRHRPLRPGAPSGPGAPSEPEAGPGA
jgi:DNA-binding HxlR family transcriptional regulator